MNYHDVSGILLDLLRRMVRSYEGRLDHETAMRLTELYYKKRDPPGVDEITTTFKKFLGKL